MFNHEKPANEIETIEAQIKNLEAEKSPLEHEKALLSAAARADGYQLRKEELQAKKGKLHVQTTQLQDQIETLKERVAKPKTIALVQANRNDIIAKNNGERWKIPDDLTLEIVFSCGHKLKISTPEIFRQQTHINSNQQLFSFWERTINSHENNMKTLVCEQCRREKVEHLKKFHTISNKQVGTARLTIEVI